MLAPARGRAAVTVGPAAHRQSRCHWTRHTDPAVECFQVNLKFGEAPGQHQGLRVTPARPGCAAGRRDSERRRRRPAGGPGAGLRRSLSIIIRAEWHHGMPAAVRRWLSDSQSTPSPSLRQLRLRYPGPSETDSPARVDSHGQTDGPGRCGAPGPGGPLAAGPATRPGIGPPRRRPPAWGMPITAVHGSRFHRVPAAAAGGPGPGHRPGSWRPGPWQSLAR
jgi:hypothetical protein